ncbi:MAG: trypsin-like peptidase domain-containing protein [Draconibacterium sp.]
MRTIISFLLFSIAVISNAQIETNYYFDDSKPSKFDVELEDFGEITYNTNFNTTESIESNKNGLLRYGHVIPVDINLKKSGKWYNKKTWKLLIVSSKAKTLELVFDNVILPKGAEINVYDINKNMVFGPMLNENIVEGYMVSTDIILGDSIIVQLDLDENMPIDNIDFSIVKIIHGIKDIFGIENKLKSAASCQVDVECTAGDGWETETEGTAKIYGNGTAGTCSLLNNTAQDFASYILTAKHVIDSIGINNVSVRFNYKATTCNGSTAASGITISGFNLRADNAVCDLALIEGVNDLSSQTSIAFLGWNRNPNPTSVVCLHHPDADFMSISKESNSISLVSPVWVRVSNWDIGSIEPGSSGSPLFDHDKRVIAATSYINSYDYVCTSSLESGHGKLSYFWPSISTYLDPCNTGATKINTIKVNSMLYAVSGSNYVCQSGSTFTFSHTLGDAPVTWSVTPTSLLNSPTSGSGSNPTIYASSNNNSGTGQITFNVGCNSYSKTFWVGNPFTPVIDGSTYITCDNELYTEDNGKSVTWSVYGPMQIVGQTYGYRCTIEGTGNGYGWVYATAANGCDTITSELFVEVDCGYLLVFSPNPASGETILSIESTSEKKIVDETVDWELEVYDNAQNLKLKNSKVKGKEYRFNTSGWKEGIYVARVKYDDKILTGKLVVKK